MSTLTVSPVRIEHLSEPLGIGVAEPRLSWTTATDDGSWRQGAYEVRLSSGGDSHTAEVAGPAQVLVPWPFEPLASRQRAQVCVRVRGEGGDWSAWSEPTTVEAGLLHPTDDVTAKMISPRGIAGLDDPAPTLTATAQARGDVASARLYITAQGLYVARINGRRVGDEQLAPGWTAYRHRLRYQTYDVTDLIEAGDNAIAVTLGNGWYRGNLGRPSRRDLYGDRLGLLAQLEITYADGSTQVIVTDENWRAHESRITSDDLYNGQSTDLRRSEGRAAEAKTGGDGAERPDEHPVDVLDFDAATLVAPEGPPIRVVCEVPAAELSLSPSGKRLVDFGQNLVGWVRLRVRGLQPGTVVTVRHAEVLEFGELGTRPLRTAQATDRYTIGTIGGEADVTLEPEFTFHGFRYAEIDGVPDLALEDLTAVVISSDLERTGWFDCSDADLNQLHENVVWGMRGNFVGVPTDCPQRDERLGWTGDIQVFAPTASFLFDTAGFLGSWLADLAAEQQPDGSVPYVIPDAFRRDGQAAAAWGDAATVVPWVLYRRFGDLGILRRQFESMRGWVDKMDALAGDDHLWVGGFQFGDWLDPTAPPDSPATAMTSHDVVATAHLAYSAGIVADAAEVLGEADARERYARLADEARAAFRAHYTTPAGLVLSDSQTAYSMALEWNLLTDDEARAHAGDRLADLVRTSGFTIGTGFVGTPLILDALLNAGHADVAYRLLLQTDCPSWLYPITMGATTIWERWDSMLADGTINPGQMTSFNHYAFGAVADWMHRRIAGLAPGEPGYRSIVVRPVLGGGLTHASARHLTPYGEASVSWRRQDGRFALEVVVPVGSSADVFLPGHGDSHTVGQGSHSWTVDDPDAGGAAGGRGAPGGRGTLGGRAMTTREAMDDAGVWERIVSLARGIRPEWARVDVAKATAQYLDLDVRELGRIVGRATVLPEERDFRAGVERMLEDRPPVG